jgi:hypothetical protein
MVRVLLFSHVSDHSSMAFLSNKQIEQFKCRGGGDGEMPHENDLCGTTSGFFQPIDPVLMDLDKGSVLLAVFPLRKRARLPTDELTLNLYEERYLAMSEFILSQQSSTLYKISSRKAGLSKTVPFFGALYSSDKPQIITQGGTAPIVPILQPGDVGVLCMVLDWVDGMIPTSRFSKEDDADQKMVKDGRTDTEPMRRRIRLNALAVGRFRIDRIVHDGTLLEDQPPFILVEAMFLRDDYKLEFDTSKMERLNERLKRLLELSSRPQTKVLPTTTTKTETPGQDPLGRVDHICSMIRYGNSDGTEQRNELMSFLAAAIVMEFSGSPNPRDMTNILRTQSLETRLNILSCYQRW